MRPFKYSKTEDAGAAVKMLSANANAQFLAGGTNIIDLMKEDVARPDELVDITRVKFAVMSEAELDWYATSGEPDDKAGAYAIQGLAARFIERIEGSYSNVVGLPIEAVYRMLSNFRF